MKTKDFLTVLFKTKNSGKIIPVLNTLSVEEKETLLANDSVLNRICEIADARMIYYFLLNMPYHLRESFLNEIESDEEYSDDLKLVINFLSLEDYSTFNYKTLGDYNIRDKDILSNILRHLSSDNLKNLISLNFSQGMNDLAFIEYSKKADELYLDPNIIKSVNENVLLQEIRKRNTRAKKTNINMQDFVELDAFRQNGILSHKAIDFLEEELIAHCKEKTKNQSKEEIVETFEKLVHPRTRIGLLEMKSIMLTVDDDTAKELVNIYFKKALGFDFSVLDKYLYAMIYHLKNDPIEELLKVSNLYDKKFTVINYLNTGVIDTSVDSELYFTITINQYQKANTKQVNKIRAKVKELANDTDTWLKYHTERFAYKLYLIFGFDNSIELLNNKFGNISFNKITKLLDHCRVDKVQFKEKGNTYEPILKDDLIQFIFGDKKDNNTVIRRMLRGELDYLIDDFAYIYENLGRIQNAIGKRIHLKALDDYLHKPFNLLPNEYKLAPHMNAIVRSSRYSDIIHDEREITKDDEKFLSEASAFYHENLEKRVISSIPRVKSQTVDGYTYETLRLDDPYVLTIGYQTGCCFRIRGESVGFLKYCCENPHARVIVIKNEHDELCAITPIIRNGNVIAGNSIESNSNGKDRAIYNALRQAYKNIMDVSKKYDEDPIVACTVTNLHCNCYSKEEVKEHIYPIRDNSFYTNYNYTAYIVAKSDLNITEKDFKYYTPNAIYYDERPKILDYDGLTRNNPEKELAKKRIDAINFNLGIEEKESYCSYYVCNEDWYLKVTGSKIEGQCLDKDPRAKEEYDAIKQYIEERLNSRKWNDYSNPISASTFNSIAPKRLILEQNKNE